MAEILLVNPRRRKRKKARRMSALQRKYFGRKRGRRRSRRSAVAASPAPRRRRRRRSHTRVARRRRRVSNPSYRRARRRITRSHRRYRRRSNPSLRGSLGSFMPIAKAGLVGATGAIGLDLLWGYASKYLPEQVAGSALAQYATKLIGAVIIGMVGGKVPFLRGRGRDLAVGASTVVLHDALKAQLSASFPQLQLGEYLTFAPTVGVMPRAGQLLSTGVGEYLSGIPDRQTDMSYTGEWNGDGMNGY